MAQLRSPLREAVESLAGVRIGEPAIGQALNPDPFLHFHAAVDLRGVDLQRCGTADASHLNAENH